MSAIAANQARKLLEPLQNEIVSLLQALVRTNTVNIPPNGNETPAQLLLAEFLRTHGLSPELYSLQFLATSGHRYVRENRNYQGRQNLTVRLPGSGRGRSLLLNGHIDTVPPGKAPWTASPWSGQIRDGRLYGLGSFDMKGGVVAQAAVIAALQKADVRVGGDLVFESVADEEWGGGSGTLAARLKGVTTDAAVISEGTQLSVLRATRGGYVVDLEVEAGDPAAYFSQNEIVSPAIPLGRLLNWVETWIERRRQTKTTGAYADVADPTPIQVLAVEANRLDSEIPLSVPTRATVRLYFQFLHEEDVDSVLTAIQASLRQFESADPFFRAHPIHWRPLYHPPLLGHELPAFHPWTQCMIGSARSVIGPDAALSAAPYPCDAFLLQREFRIPTLLFGPRGAGAHNPDEYVEVDSVLTAAETLLVAALEWCNG